MVRGFLLPFRPVGLEEIRAFLELPEFGGNGVKVWLAVCGVRCGGPGSSPLRVAGLVVGVLWTLRSLLSRSHASWMCCPLGNPQVSRASAALSSAGVRLWFTGGTARPVLLGWESPSAGRPSGSVAPMATAIVVTPVATCSNCARQQARSMSCACTVTEISGQPVRVRAVSGTPGCRFPVPTPLVLQRRL